MFTIKRFKKFWAVWEGESTLVCVCVYRRGAEEVKRRLEAK